MGLIRKHWFLMALTTSIVIGFLFSRSCEWLSEIQLLKWSIVTATMFLMAWPMAIGALKKTLSRPAAPLLASAINLGLIPLIAWPLSKFLGAEFGPGLIVVAATPATLASAAVWTRRAGGNDGIAILVTIITNMICFFVTPFWVFALTGNEVERSVFVGTMVNLLLFVVLPIILAQLVRLHARSAEWATVNKPRLSLLAQVGILCMVFLGAVKSGIRIRESDSTIFNWGDVCSMLLAVTAIHAGTLWIGFRAARVLKMPEADQIAVGIAGSQKTLMVGLSVALSFGMSILPLVAYHTIQLVCDTFVVEHLRRAAERKREGDASAS